MINLTDKKQIKELILIKKRNELSEIYEKIAKKYQPKKIKMLFIAESPPYTKKGKELRYFYLEKAKGKDFLFSSIIDVLFPKEHTQYKQNKDKTKLLNKFKEEGFFLIDACNFPINQYKHRNLIIQKNSLNLRLKIDELINKKTPIILIKKNIYLIFNEKLKSEGYNILNKTYLEFPSCGNQKKFKKKLHQLLHQYN